MMTIPLENNVHNEILMTASNDDDEHKKISASSLTGLLKFDEVSVLLSSFERVSAVLVTSVSDHLPLATVIGLRERC